MRRSPAAIPVRSPAAVLAAVLAGLAVVTAGYLAWSRLRPGPVAAAAPQVATLQVLTGSAQVVPAGTGTAAVAGDGDRLHAGDRVATGPGTWAVLDLDGGGQVRLDSGSVAVLRGGGRLDLLAGRAWARRLTAAPLELAAGGTVFSAAGAGSEFQVSAAPGPLALAVAGGVAAGDRRASAGQLLSAAGPPRAATAAELASPWLALNRALDRDPSRDGPAAIGAGELLPGEESSAQQAVTIPEGGPKQAVVFTAAWTAGSLELEVLDPGGAVYRRVAGGAGDRSASVTVPAAGAGGWAYRVRQLEGGEEGDDWFVAVSELPA